MRKDTSKEKLLGFRSINRKWWKVRSDDQGNNKANTKRERYIGILQKRYGYTKEKARSELDTNYSKIRFG